MIWTSTIPSQKRGIWLVGGKPNAMLCDGIVWDRISIASPVGTSNFSRRRLQIRFPSEVNTEHNMGQHDPSGSVIVKIHRTNQLEHKFSSNDRIYNETISHWPVLTLSLLLRTTDFIILSAKPVVSRPTLYFLTRLI